MPILYRALAYLVKQIIIISSTTMHNSKMPAAPAPAIMAICSKCSPDLETPVKDIRSLSII